MHYAVLYIVGFQLHLMLLLIRLCLSLPFHLVICSICTLFPFLFLPFGAIALFLWFNFTSFIDLLAVTLVILMIALMFIPCYPSLPCLPSNTIPSFHKKSKNITIIYLSFSPSLCYCGHTLYFYISYNLTVHCYYLHFNQLSCIYYF